MSDPSALPQMSEKESDPVPTQPHPQPSEKESEPEFHNKENISGSEPDFQHKENVSGSQSPSPSQSDDPSPATEYAPAPAPTVWSWKAIIATIGLSGLYVGSQIPLYFVGGSLTAIVEDIGAAEASSWITVAYALPMTAISPFCGYLQDLFGRRYVTLAGGIILMIGIILMGTTHTFRQSIVGMGFAGGGAAMAELTALAGTAELVPVKQRGLYLGYVTAVVLPFTPYVLYCELLATYYTWRWGMWICLIWVGLSWGITLLFYFPQSQTRAAGATTMSIVKRIDYIGGLLSIVGITLILVALQSGGYDHPWKSGYVLAQLLVGIALVAAFVIWEWKFAVEPIIPREMFAGQRICAMMFTVSFIAGMNFYASLNFLPIEYKAVFPPDPARVGMRAFPAGIATTFGAVVGNAALTWFKGRNRDLITVACIVMTAFTGAMAAVTPEREGLSIGIGFMAGLGIGFVLVPSVTIAMTVVPDTIIATCVALSIAIRSLGGAVGTAIYYNVFIGKLNVQLPFHVAREAVEAGLPSGEVERFVALFLTDPASAAGLPGVTDRIIEAATIGTRWGYSDALKYVWLVAITFGGCAIILSAFIGDVSKYMTDRVAATLM